LNEVTS